MDPMKMVTIVSPYGVVCKLGPNIVTGPFIGFTATFELPPSLLGQKVDYEQVMKDALGFALQKYIETQKAELQETKIR